MLMTEKIRSTLISGHAKLVESTIKKLRKDHEFIAKHIGDVPIGSELPKSLEAVYKQYAKDNEKAGRYPWGSGRKIS